MNLGRSCCSPSNSGTVCKYCGLRAINELFIWELFESKLLFDVIFKMLTLVRKLKWEIISFMRIFSPSETDEPELESLTDRVLRATDS